MVVFISLSLCRFLVVDGLKILKLGWGIGKAGSSMIIPSRLVQPSDQGVYNSVCSIRV